MSRYNALKKHKNTSGKVYGAAVNAKRKRYCKDLKEGVAHSGKGEVICNAKTGGVAVLSEKQKSYRSGYVDGVSESVAAAKTAAGLKANEKIYPGIELNSEAVMTAFAYPGTPIGKIEK